MKPNKLVIFILFIAICLSTMVSFAGEQKVNAKRQFQHGNYLVAASKLRTKRTDRKHSLGGTKHQSLIDKSSQSLIDTSNFESVIKKQIAYFKTLIDKGTPATEQQVATYNSLSSTTWDTIVDLKRKIEKNDVSETESQRVISLIEYYDKQIQELVQTAINNNIIGQVIPRMINFKSEVNEEELDPVLLEKIIQAANKYYDEFNEPLVITSGKRDFDEQVKLMAGMTDDQLIDLYNGVYYVKEIIKNAPIMAGSISRDIEKVKAILERARKNGSFISKHLNGKAVDIRAPSSQNKLEAAKQYLNELDLKVKDETNNGIPCIHVFM